MIWTLASVSHESLSKQSMLSFSGRSVNLHVSTANVNVKLFVVACTSQPSHLITGLSEEMVDKDPNFLRDLERFVLSTGTVHHQEVHL